MLHYFFFVTKEGERDVIRKKKEDKLGVNKLPDNSHFLPDQISNSRTPILACKWRLLAAWGIYLTTSAVNLN
jgi:hypothetical protein